MSHGGKSPQARAAPASLLLPAAVPQLGEEMAKAALPTAASAMSLSNLGDEAASLAASMISAPASRTADSLSVKDTIAPLASAVSAQRTREEAMRAARALAATDLATAGLALGPGRRKGSDGSSSGSDSARAATRADLHRRLMQINMTMVIDHRRSRKAADRRAASPTLMDGSLSLRSRL